MPRLIVIEEGKLRAILSEALARALAEGAALDFVPGSGPEPATAVAPQHGNSPPENKAADPPRYKIGAGKAYSYADVVTLILPSRTFTLSEAYAKVKDRVESKSRRVREMLKRSLDNDPRFARVKRQDGRVAYKRTDDQQSLIE